MRLWCQQGLVSELEKMEVTGEGWSLNLSFGVREGERERERNKERKKERKREAWSDLTKWSLPLGIPE